MTKATRPPLVTRAQVRPCGPSTADLTPRRGAAYARRSHPPVLSATRPSRILLRPFCAKGLPRNASPMPTAAHKRLPRLAIIGRPNVGKSTLANRMCGSRVSIVEPTAGVTRDRVSVPAFLRASNGERWVEVVDTGGIGIVDRDDLGPQLEEQIATAIATSDVILWLVDVREGITPLDQEVARRLRGLAFPILLVVNKVEGRKLEWDVDVFRRFGVG